MPAAKMLRRLSVALAALVTLLASPADAQVTKISTQVCERNSCVRSIGTCVNIGVRGDRAYFLTAGHCIRGGQVVLVHTNNGAHEARVEAIDATPDLALVSTTLAASTSYFPLAEEVSVESCEFVGFTQGGPYRVRKATRLRREGWHLVADCFADYGDSGGPYLSGGRVVGVCWGSTGQQVVGTDCVTIRHWLRARVGFIPGDQPPQSPTQQPPAVQPPSQPILTPPAAVACGCSAEINTLKQQVAALQAKCNQPPAPVEPAPDNTAELEARLDALEKQIAAAGELAKRIDALEYKLAEVRLAGGKTEQLEKELAALRDMTFEVRSLSPDGKVVSSKRQRLGENIDLRLVPKSQK